MCRPTTATKSNNRGNQQERRGNELLRDTTNQMTPPPEQQRQDERRRHYQELEEQDHGREEGVAQSNNPPRNNVSGRRGTSSSNRDRSRSGAFVNYAGPPQDNAINSRSNSRTAHWSPVTPCGSGLPLSIIMDPITANVPGDLSDHQQRSTRLPSLLRRRTFLQDQDGPPRQKQAGTVLSIIDQVLQIVQEDTSDMMRTMPGDEKK